MAAGGENHAWTKPGIGSDCFPPRRGNCSNCNFARRGISVTVYSSPRRVPTRQARPRSQRSPDSTRRRKPSVAELKVCLARSFDITCTYKVQSIIHQIQAALGGNVGWFIGLVILGLLTLYLAIGPSGQALSVDRWLAVRRRGPAASRPAPSAGANLALRLINLQQRDGSWSSENGRWWERDPSLVTAYAVLSLEMIYRAL